MVQVKILPDAASLAHAAAAQFAALAVESTSRGWRFSVALAGGSTPKAMYEILASKTHTSLDWRGVHLFWGDERCVPPDHPQSNYRMARNALLERIPIPPGNVHRIQGELTPESAAKAYEEELQRFFSIEEPGEDPQTSPPENDRESRPRRRTFDLVLLGMGEDGHTASLFPGSPALEETERWVTSVEHSQPPPPQVDRVSLTLPAINAAAHVTILVSGKKKADRLQQAISSQEGAQPDLPVQLVKPENGDLLWLVDAAAAGMTKG